jgi:KDO2-lipid IV(A) lauroyltransferase
MRYEAEIRGPFQCARGPGRHAAIREMTAMLNAELEAAIRRSPEQYLWMHRRWRFR